MDIKGIPQTVVESACGIGIVIYGDDFVMLVRDSCADTEDPDAPACFTPPGRGLWNGGFRWQMLRVGFYLNPDKQDKCVNEIIFCLSQ